MNDRSSAPKTVLRALIDQAGGYRSALEKLQAHADQRGFEVAPFSERSMRRLASGTTSGRGPRDSRVRMLLESYFGSVMDDLLQVPSPDRHTKDGITSRVSCPQGWLAADNIPAADIIEPADYISDFFGLDWVEISHERLAYFDMKVRSISKAYTSRPAVELLSELVRLQTALLGCLKLRIPPRESRELFRWAGVVSCMVANAHHDLGLPATAREHGKLAEFCAKRVGDNELHAFALAMQSLISYRSKDGNLDHALEYARSGLALHPKGTTSIWLHMCEARVLARKGNMDRTLSSIRRAKEALDSHQASDLDSFGGIFLTSEAEHHYYASDALVRLPGMTKQALLSCLEAVHAYEDPNTPGWDYGCQACSHANLAIARIKMGEFDGAATALLPILRDLGPERWIRGVEQSAQDVDAELKKNTTALRSRAGRELYEAIETQLASIVVPRRRTIDATAGQWRLLGITGTS